ncbi:MAG TPA: 2OG-Fe(II) oxygenase family protein, partial [Pseudomonadales bacterium]|nr:2OG-Fe(II) oxygenase family protein [Pseudomonadales bacterium]
AALDAACADHGFFLLAGHGLDDIIERTWRETTRFFDADRAVRIAIARDEHNALGYYDRELTKRKRDTKEVFDFADPQVQRIDAKNRWPALPDFRTTMAEFFDAFAGLAARTLGLLHATLELTSAGRATMAHSRHTSTVRLNHYPTSDPVPAAERASLPPLGETALGYHTDPGVLTLLLQDDTGGLQTQSRSGEWIDVPPRPGTIVVNLGDCMQSWTNDRWRAAVHRVVPMTRRRRFSIPYFGNPARDAIIEPVPELSTQGPRYRPVAWRAFIQARVDDNFTDLGADDTQMAQYRIPERSAP